MEPDLTDLSLNCVLFKKASKIEQQMILSRQLQLSTALKVII